VIDADGKESDFIDVIIYDRQFTPPVFNKLYIPAESVYAVIEAKQTLNRENIVYAGGKRNPSGSSGAPRPRSSTRVGRWRRTRSRSRSASLPAS
jgi:hypothetical protein